MPIDYERKAGQKPITLGTLLWPVLMIGMGIYQVWRHSTSTGGVILGSLIILGGALLLVVGVILKFVIQADNPDAMASKLADQQKKLFGGLNEYRDATDNDFAKLDRNYYEQTTRQALAVSFRQVKDVVNVTASETWPRNIAVIRCFLGDGGTTMAAGYQLRLLGGFQVLQWLGVIPRVLKTFECETEFSDGTFVTTANSIDFDKSLGYPFIDRLQFKSDISVADLVVEHRTHVQRVLGDRPGVRPVVMRDADDLRASQDRMQLLKNAHRLSPNFDHRAEWEKINGRPLRPEAVALVQAHEAQMRSTDSTEPTH